jgi:hypothetical protein
MRRRARYGAWRWAAALAAVAALAIGVRAMESHPSPAIVARHSAAVEGGAARAVAALTTQTAPRREHEAESLAFAPAAPSTMAFNVRLDGRAPGRCVVTKSSGNHTLDQAVCRAALRTVASRRSH